MYEIEELDPRICIMMMEKNDHETHLMAHLVSPTSHCPDCGARCDRRHGFTWRRIGDLFRIQHCIRLTLRVPKWFCDNPNCERIIFTERLAWAVPYSRRTNRTNHVLTTLPSKKDVVMEQSSAMHRPIVQSNYSVHGIPTS